MLTVRAFAAYIDHPMPQPSPEMIERAALRYAGKVYAAATLDHAEVARAMRAVIAIPRDMHINTSEARGWIVAGGRFVAA